MNNSERGKKVTRKSAFVIDGELKIGLKLWLPADKQIHLPAAQEKKEKKKDERKKEKKRKERKANQCTIFFVAGMEEKFI